MHAKEALIAARKRIEKPENWIQGTFYRQTGVTEAYCASGALNAVCHADSPTIDEAYSLLCSAMNAEDVSAWNDHADRTHADVLAAFDRAIAQAALAG